MRGDSGGSTSGCGEMVTVIMQVEMSHDMSGHLIDLTLGIDSHVQFNTCLAKKYSHSSRTSRREVNARHVTNHVTTMKSSACQAAPRDNSPFALGNGQDGTRQSLQRLTTTLLINLAL